LLASEEEERRGKKESEPSKLEKNAPSRLETKERKEEREEREKEEISETRTFAFSWFLAIMVVRLAFDLLLSRRRSA